MLNINELESKWKRYKIKSYIPHAVIFVSTLIILILSLTFFTPDTNQIDEIVQVEPVIAPKKVEAKPQVQETSEPVVQKEETVEPSVEIVKTETPKKTPAQSKQKKITLTPSLDFMKSINRDALPYYTQGDDDTPSRKQDEEELDENQEESTSNTKQDDTTQSQAKEPESISIKRGTTQDDIQHVLKRFKKNNNPALSLFIAQKYYDLGDYHNSYNYALITNEINNNIEDSWIIFTKSLVKLDQKDMAIKTLKQYLEYSNSSKANRLLEEILSGKFQ